MLKKIWVATLLLFSLGSITAIADECKAPTCYSTISDKDNYRIELRTSKAIPVNSLFNLTVNVTNKEGKPLKSTVNVEIDAGMPQHNHGMNVTPVVKALDNGQFSVEGMLFHMPGAWTINLSIAKGIMRDEAKLIVEVQ